MQGIGNEKGMRFRYVTSWRSKASRSRPLPLCHELSWINFETKRRQARRVISNELFSARHIFF